MRLAEIDAPERRQPFGDRGAQMLPAHLQRRVRIVVTGTDRNRRVIGRVSWGASTSTPRWSAAAAPGCSAATPTILRCCASRPRRKRRDEAFGAVAGTARAAVGVAREPAPPLKQRSLSSG